MRFPADSHLLDDLVESLIGAGEFERAREVLAAAEAAAGDDKGLRADAVVSRLHIRIETEPELDLDELRAQVAVASAQLDRLGDHQGLARTWRMTSYERLVRCRIGESETAMTRAIEHARLAGNGRVLAWGRALLAATAYWGPIPVGDGIERCNEILAEAGDNPYVGTSALHVLGALHAMRGEFERARELVADGAVLLGRLGANRLAGIAGQFAAAAGNELLERVGDTGARSNVAADLAMVAAMQGRTDTAVEWARTATSLAPHQDLYVQIRRRAASARARFAGPGACSDRSD